MNNLSNLREQTWPPSLAAKEFPTLNITDAFQARCSIRAFLDRPVRLALLRDAVQRAARAPSGDNVQPWQIHVLASEPLREFEAIRHVQATRAPGQPT